MLEGPWAWVACIEASIAVAAIAIIFLVKKGYHRDTKGAITRRRLASVLGLAASSYTFMVCVVAQLLFRGEPGVSDLIRNGFGDERIAWLLFLVTADQVFRLWDEYRPING
ncbi:MAG: hypothetical protein Gyms2KO_35720 [Gymnodinialimonas sp.]